MQHRELHQMGTYIQLSVQHAYADVILDELMERFRHVNRCLTLVKVTELNDEVTG